MKKVVVALMLCCMFAGVFAAKGDGSISILGGYTIPVIGDTWGNSSTGYKGSFALAGAGDYQFHDMMAAGLEGGYNFNHEHQTGIDALDVKMWYLTPYLKIMQKMEQMTFYGILGVGIYRFTTDFSLAGLSLFKDFKDNVTAFGFNVGGGVMFDVSENIQAGIDVRWHHAFEVFADKSDINNIVPSVKFSFFFGK